MNIVDKILIFIEKKNISKREFYIKTGLSNGFLDKVSSIGSDKIEKILNTYPELSLEWLITGKGTMLKGEKTTEMPVKSIEKRNFIPLHNDVMSIGGSSLVANGSSSSTPEMIDAGDWFPGATDAIRHYGDSMREYPSGCILALKKVNDLLNGFILGQNYVIEYGTDYNRVTKRIQRKGKIFWAYSTNEEVYADGSLIHQPFEVVPIHNAWRVLGCVIKTESSTGVVKVAR